MRSAPLLCVLALVSIPSLSRAQTPMPEDEKAIWQAVNAWDQARLKADVTVCERVEAPAYQLTGPDSVVISRKLGLDQLKAGTFQYRAWSRHEASVKLSDDAAVMTGRAAVAVVVEGTPAQGIYAFTETFIKREGKWLALATQLTQIAPTDRLAVEPLPRDYGWIKRHDKFVEQAKHGGIDLLFLGDSITDFWRSRGLNVYQKYFGTMKIDNFGISGDRTEHVLWRMEHGELDGIQPKAIMLMIGTNNVGTERDGVTLRNTPHEAAEGVKAIVAELRAKLPDAKILLLAVFPRGHLPDDPNRVAAGQINPEIAGLADGDHVRYLDFGRQFLTSEGVLDRTIMPDYLHPSPAGYEIWAQAVKGPLAEMMR